MTFSLHIITIIIIIIMTFDKLVMNWELDKLNLTFTASIKLDIS